VTDPKHVFSLTLFPSLVVTCLVYRSLVMSGSSRSQSRSHSRATFSNTVSVDVTASETQRHDTTDPSEESSVAVVSSHETASPRTVLPVVPSVPAAASQQRGPRIRHTARMQVFPPGSFPDRSMGPPHMMFHPDDPYAASLTPSMDRYMRERLSQRPDGAGPSRPPPQMSPVRMLTPAEYHALRMDLQGLTQEAEQQAHLLFQVSDAAHRLSEHSVRVTTTTQATSSTVQRLVSVCLVMGTLIAIIILKMFLDMLH
jgi:hypothetical protein